jgi:phosphatidylserine/phosphatidylglycerophosphate/cardiolipin synthase-like enzyme
MIRKDGPLVKWAPARVRIFAAVLTLLIMVSMACSISIPTDITEPDQNPTSTSSTNSQGSSQPASPDMPAWLAVYFTDPNPPDNLGNGIDQYVKPVIDSATQTIDVASFDLNLPSLVNALADASQRGVKVRVVYDGTNGNLDLNNDATDNQDFNPVRVLTKAKAKLVDGGRSNGLMHDKMIIVDSNVLFMGSWNLSYNDTYRNNNNLLMITDLKLIANYQAKFNEMFVDKRFGTKAEVKVPYPSLTIDDVQVENYFSPEDEVMAHLVHYVENAQITVHYMIFTYTHKDLAAAMIARVEAGVEVEGVIEDRGATQGALVDLFCAKLPVKTDGNKYTMHHKVIIIDNNTVITGSFNFTKAADTANDDNLLVIHSPAVAALYEQEFQKMYSLGNPPEDANITCK